MKKLIPLVLVSLLISPLTANAFLSSFTTKSVVVIAGISHHSKTLPEKEIIRLSRLSDEKNGTKKIGAHHESVWVKQSNELSFADERQTIIPTNTRYRIAMASG